MNNPTQCRSCMPGISRRVAGAALALAIMLVLAVLATGSAQAQTYTEKVAHSFTGSPGGEYPEAGLVRDAQGNLDGATSNGGLTSPRHKTRSSPISRYDPSAFGPLRSSGFPKNRRSSLVDKLAAAPFSGLLARSVHGAGLRETSWYSYPLFGGGEMTSIAMDPSNSQTVYVGTRGAGVFKTSNSGQSWQPARNDLTFYPIRSLRVNPQDPKTLYAGTDFDGIWKSIDGGSNWFKSSTGLDDGLIVFQIVINPLNPNTIYAGLAGGVGLVIGDIYESKDGGTSWEKRDGGMPRYEGYTYTNGIISLAIDPTNPLLLYAGTTFNGAFESADGGGSWIAINNNLPILSGAYLKTVNALAVDTHHTNSLAAIIAGEYYVFLNNQWQLTSQNHFYNGGIDRAFLYFHPTDPRVIYSSGDTFSKSTDGGPNWINYLGWGARTESGNTGEIAFAPSAPNNIYAATSPLFDYFSITAWITAN